MHRDRTQADVISVAIAAAVMLSVQAALTFQKYRFDNGLMLGITLAAVHWYEESARRRNARPSGISLILVVTAAAALTVVLQEAVRALAAALPLLITHS